MTDSSSISHDTPYSSSSSSKQPSLVHFFYDLRHQSAVASATATATTGFATTSATRSQGELLDRCVRFLTQGERAFAARASKFLFSVCSSAASWSVELDDDNKGVQQQLLDPNNDSSSSSSLLSSALRCKDLHTRGEHDEFRFNAPAVRCTPATIRQARASTLFRQARCLEFRSYSWHASNSLILSREEEPAEEWALSDSWPHLEHFFGGSSKSEKAFWKTLGTLPSGLKSCTMIFQGNMAPTSCLSFLPPNLHTLQLLNWQNATMQLTDLRKLTKLQRLVLIGPNSTAPLLQRSFFVSYLAADQLLPTLRIYCDAREVTDDIFKAMQGLQSFPAAAATMSRALTHVRLFDCGVFDSFPSDVDWAALFPHLDSFHVEYFPFRNASTIPSTSELQFPVALGARVRSLIISEVNFPSESEGANLITFNDFINLEKLTIRKVCLADLHKIGGLPKLTHLSVESVSTLPLGSGLRECTPEIVLRQFLALSRFNNLKILDITDNMWPPSLLEKDIHSQQLTVDEFVRVLAASDPINGSQSTAKPPQTNSVQSLTSAFPSLTELNVSVSLSINPSAKLPTSSFEARSALQSIRSLVSVKWCYEPRMHPRDIDSHYSLEAIQGREVKRLRRLQQNCLPPTEQERLRSRKPDLIVDAEILHPNSTIARDFNMFNLSLAFQALTPVEVARASTVSRHWRSASLSPLVLRHRFRVEMHQLQGAIVHGPQIRISDPLPMMQAVGSAVFRNLRILTLGQYSAPLLPRETHFANRYLHLFEQIPRFTSLHTLALSWTQPPYNYSGSGLSDMTPSAFDLATICRVLESSALQHLKVFRMMAPPDVISILLRLLPKLKTLEVVELRYMLDYKKFTELAWDFSPLLQLPMLQRLYVCDYGMHNDEKQLLQLRDFCTGVSTERFEEVLWRVSITHESLEQITSLLSSDKSFSLPHVKSIHIVELNESLQALSNASAALPHVWDISIGKLIEATSNTPIVVNPFPAPLASRLRSLKLKIEERTSPHGIFILPVLQALVDSKLIQLECLHIFRQMIVVENSIVNNSEAIVNDTLYQLIERSPALTELYCPTFDLGGSGSWVRLLPRLHVVYAHPLVTPFLEHATLLREYHCQSAVTRTLFQQLLALPHFQSVSCLAEDRNRVTYTRGEVARKNAEWLQREEEAKQTKQRAVQLLESTTLNPEQLHATWQQVNAAAQKTSRRNNGIREGGDLEHKDVESDDHLLADILHSLSTS